MDKDHSVRYAAIIHNVREVILAGTANLAFWRDVLQPQGLYPFSVNGLAEILISAPRLTWMGMRFCEWSVGISVAKRDDAIAPDGLFLAHAFNTSKLLAWAERTFFSTPYYQAMIDVTDTLPARIVVTVGQVCAFDARMSPQATLLRNSDETWEGPIFLPHKNTLAPRNYFLAHLSGDTQTYAFTANADVFELKPAQPNDVIAQLRDSGFTPREWRVRQNALHAKSRTMRE